MLEHVTIIGFRKVLGTSITIPMEMLNAANLIKRIDGKGYHRLKMEVVSVDGKNLQLTGGLELVCNSCLDSIEDTHLIIVPALWGNPMGVIKQYPSIIEFLRRQHERGTPICAVGTGSYFLAEAGLLHNKVATTHWYYFDQFEHNYPDIRLQRDRFITRAGNLYCAGSVNSVRDVMLYYIEEAYSANIAHQISRHFTHEVKRSYTSSILKNSPQHIHDDEAIINIQEWLHSRYHAEISLPLLAEKFGMSVRTLTRHISKATATTPIQNQQQVRIDNAKELLKNTNLSISEVAASVGYSDSSYFTAQFKKSISLPPKEYRRLVRKKLFRLES